jgi:hypothetical protein
VGGGGSSLISDTNYRNFVEDPQNIKQKLKTESSMSPTRFEPYTSIMKIVRFTVANISHSGNQFIKNY